ncbi:MAG TPA: type II toxin-antitoxin system RelE/ParE family toxin [Candidatus Bacteroides intestinavium]|uniref:Type II toxin-antitoxin system RelE/ParE family toxin n=1 Tax=Candidatus Bacteroides intestinavium TaxID=2838469 RepID=A0A9D2KU26_9BACE|nr:type II toxin-antitoxin system RelE/ParE family toxin [Candidatus Bacteroides intestinavium]
MSRKIIYDTQARQQIGEIYRYGKERFGPQTAARFKETLRQTIALLKQHPLMGSVEPELSTDCHEYRYLLVNPYKVIYSVTDETVRIHLLWHTGRDPRTMARQMADDNRND